MLEAVRAGGGFHAYKRAFADLETRLGPGGKRRRSLAVAAV